MKVLVIGGNRFFGKRLVRLLAEAGHEVTVANRGSRPGLFAPPIKTIIVDRRDEKAMMAAFSDTSWDVVYDQVCFGEAEAEITKRVFANRIGKLIFTSSASVYDTAPNMPESFFDSSSFNNNKVSENDYQHGKRLAEKSYSDADFPAVSMRISVVVAIDDHSKRINWHIDRVMKQEAIYFPNIDARYSFIRSEDAAKFLFWLLSNETVSGAIKASSPDPICLRDFMKNIEKTAAKKLCTPAERQRPITLHLV